METTYIWVIDTHASINKNIIEIEIFEGRNKYTKRGLYSGPLRRKPIDISCIDRNIKYLYRVDKVSQVSRNKFAVSTSNINFLFQYLHESGMDSLYCKLDDSKLYHVSVFINAQLEKLPFKYNKNEMSLIYNTVKDQDDFIDNNKVQSTSKLALNEIVPIPKLYLTIDGNNIKGSLYFSYLDIELSSDSKQTYFQYEDKFILRDIKKENEYYEKIISLGAKKSYKNQVSFIKKIFFSTTLFKLQQENIILYWGEDKKQVASAKFNCSISYNTNWFELDGTVEIDQNIIKLSDLLQSSRGKSFIEIDKNIVFLPESIQNISQEEIKDNKIIVDKAHTLDIMSISDEYTVNPQDFFEKILNSSDKKIILNLEKNVILKEYQTKGVDWLFSLYQKNIGCCLADDMGLGKTIQAIAFISRKEKQILKPSIIVVPKIVLYNWENEFNKFAPHQKIEMIYGKYNYSLLVKNIDNKTVYLTTYETIVRNIDIFSNILFDTLILDEAQFVKNSRSKRYNAIKNLKREFTLALSGTPIENNLDELWSISNLLNNGILGKHKEFLNRFNTTEDNNIGFKRLNKIVSLFFLRRTKESELKDLPSKTEEYIYCSMEQDQYELYNYLLSSTKKELSSKGERFKIKDNAAILQSLLYLREVCSEPQLLPHTLKLQASSSCKFEMFKMYAQKITESNNKIIIYSQFPRLLKKLEDWSTEQGYKTFYLDGKTKNRQDVVNNFEKSDSGIFFISLKAGGVGLNLTSCQYIIIYEPWWNLAAEQQASNRIYRIGQEKPVFIYHFLVKNSIEEKIYELQQKKQHVFNNTMTNLDSFEKVTMKELYNILLKG